MVMELILEFWKEANLAWEKGGFLMPVLGLLSFYTYYLAFDLWLKLRSALLKSRHFPVKNGVHSREVDVNDIMRYCIGDHANAKQTRKKFDQIRTVMPLTLIAGCDSSWSLLPRLLIGLLGTVVGMLRTLDGLSMQDSYKMDTVASGISQALVTTQTGLLVSIPALALIHLLNRRKKAWLTFITRLESLAIRQVSSATNPS